MMNLLRNLFTTFFILMLLVFMISLNVKEALGSMSGAKLCPPGYIIDEGGFCDLEVTSAAPHLGK